jgi:hypothetical protein
MGCYAAIHVNGGCIFVSPKAKNCISMYFGLRFTFSNNANVDKLCCIDVDAGEGFKAST